MRNHEFRASYIEKGHNHRMVLHDVEGVPDQVLGELRARFPERYFYCWCSSHDGPCHCAKSSSQEEVLPARAVKIAAQRRLVRDIMSSPAVTVGMDCEINEILALMADRDFQHLPVIGDRGRMVGMISDRDILRSLSPFVGKGPERPLDTHTLQLKAHQIMSRHIVGISGQATLASAASLMREKGIHCLPVLDDNCLAGILTATDLLDQLC
ncbi:MAG TPA: CBS domain-containing protein [Acidobacteriota bacterium]|nr:CBS domain-containing protein [Acidobacteriota bacterium]